MKSSDLCSICLDEPSDIVLDCMHAFCENCITDWNQKSRTCPICRKDINVDLEDKWVITYNTDKDLAKMAEETIAYVIQYVKKCKMIKLVKIKQNKA
mmetsp:Transcript_430/g.715  ORF Transcript_430/g.715 Transcript_430/m.715 type:complete len:97 (+) Transcript_430:755-1045(+)